MASIVGVDIGSRSLRAVEVQGADRAKPVTTRFHEVPLPEGSVRRGEVVDANTVASAFRRLWSTGGFSTKNVVLGMGGPSVIARELTVQRMPLARIREALPYQVQELLPLPVADAVLDFYPIAEAPPSGGNAMVTGLLIAAVKQSVAANVAAASAAGLRPVEVDLIPFAIARILGRTESPRGTVAIVNVGADTTNVTISSAGVPQFVRIIPSGGDDVTRALQARLDITLDRAEAIKRERGISTLTMSVEDRPATETIYQQTSELLGSLRDTLHYFQSTTQRAVDRIVLSGGGARISGFERALGEVVGLPVSTRNGFAGIGMSRAARSQHSTDLAGDMTVALGLALGSKS